jgi:hypothetical protein
MSPYGELARQLESGMRWSNLMLAQSRLSLLTMRLMLREGRGFGRRIGKAKRSARRKKRG